MKTLALKDGRVLEIEVSYSKGGINYFTGNRMRRGYSLHLTPVRLEVTQDGQVTMRSFTIGADPKDKGLASFLLEVARQSPKAQAQAETIAASRLNRVINEWLTRSGCELVDPVPPHSIVGYTELPTILLTPKAPGALSNLAAPQKEAPPKEDDALPRAMRMTQEELKRLPALGSDATTAQVKFFQPWGGWTWYMMEYDPSTYEGFGYVVGHEPELGYFNLKELGALRGIGGLTIERDRHFKPMTLEALKTKYEGVGQVDLGSVPQ